MEYKDGYKSWSPKDVFEESYKKSETFIDRLFMEFCELEERINRLGTFIDSLECEDREEMRKLLKLNDVSFTDYTLMKEQMIKMKEYFDILGIRTQIHAYKMRIKELES